MEIKKMLAHEWGLTVDPEFRNLLAEHTQEERAMFEYSLQKEGCTEALTVWLTGGKRVIVDGHHRFAYCAANDIEFAVQEMDFADRDAAKEYIIRHQLARRNLPIHEKARLALAYKPIIEERAKQNQGKRTDLWNIVKNSTQSSGGRTREKLADIAGVSFNTIDKVETIEAEAPKPIVDAARKGEITVNAAYNITKLDTEKRDEAVRRIEGGENPKAVAHDVLGHKQNHSNGWTKEDRESRAKTLEIIDQMKNGDVPEYTLDMLLEDIQINAKACFGTLNAILEQHNDLINDKSKPRISSAIEKHVIKVANELRRKIA